MLERTLTLGKTRKTVSAELRATIREICRAPERMHYAPEDFLIAFKLALVDAATRAKIAPGPERNDFIAKLVSVYIDEFYRSDSVLKQPDVSNGSQELRAEL
ncbi:MAG: hypothetical protein ACRENK_01640 [Gemmatimonadaceae bacterium]